MAVLPSQKVNGTNLLRGVSLDSYPTDGLEVVANLRAATARLARDATSQSLQASGRRNLGAQASASA
jgi:hypothetical protein